MTAQMSKIQSETTVWPRVPSKEQTMCEAKVERLGYH